VSRTRNSKLPGIYYSVLKYSKEEGEVVWLWFDGGTIRFVGTKDQTRGRPANITAQVNPDGP
jgi:hypothetical protein